LQRAAKIEIRNSSDLRAAIGRLFDRFVAKGAKACAISLPPDFSPQRPEGVEATVADWLRSGEATSAETRHRLSQFVFWTLAEFCAEHSLPFDLMIGVVRKVYPAGVHQGQDLYDSRVSLIQYRQLLNAFPQVKFPISVLASVTNQELASYAWIFPNVFTSGHWWYSNAPSFIERDLSARLEAVPGNKQIGYYSDAYKLEFIWPKFRMYKQILAKVLAEQFVLDRGWSESRAIELGRRLLRTNVEQIFR
jgi:glucuronate isomerase